MIAEAYAENPKPDLYYERLEYARIKRDLYAIKNMQFKVELCENIENSTDEDHIAMPIEDEDEIDGGFLHVYGYKESSEQE